MGMYYWARALTPEEHDMLVDDPTAARITRLLQSGVGLDKMWDAARVLLEGSTSHPAGPLLSGVPIGPDLGYGPAMLAPPDVVARISDDLAAFTEADLRSRFDPEAMGDAMVYPNVWDDADDEELDDLATDTARAAHRIVELYRQAAEQQAPILAAVI